MYDRTRHPKTNHHESQRTSATIVRGSERKTLEKLHVYGQEGTNVIPNRNAYEVNSSSSTRKTLSVGELCISSKRLSSPGRDQVAARHLLRMKEALEVEVLDYMYRLGAGLGELLYTCGSSEKGVSPSMFDGGGMLLPFNPETTCVNFSKWRRREIRKRRMESIVLFLTVEEEGERPSTSNMRVERRYIVDSCNLLLQIAPIEK